MLKHNYSIPKYLYFVIGIIVGIFILLLIQRPKAEELVDFSNLAKPSSDKLEKTRLIALISNDAEITIVGPGGKEVPVCAKIEGTKIEDTQQQGCKLNNVRLKNLNTIQLFIVEGSPEKLCVSDSSKKTVQCASALVPMRCHRDPATGKLVCP